MKIFGQDYSLNESLAYSLQFSLMRTEEQKKSNKSVLSKEMKEIKGFIDAYRISLKDNVFQSQEYTVRLIQIPKVSNTNRGDLAVEFVNWNQLDQKDREAYEKVTAIIKDKVVRVEAANVGKLKPSIVVNKVNERTKHTINHYIHRCIYTVFGVRPSVNSDDPFDTNTKYCHYNEVHDDYLYQEGWVDFIVDLLNENKLSLSEIKRNFDKDKNLDVEAYEA